ncbi:MAG: fasciclin domain-containing protein [Leptolyngbya sp. Prado105]|jgi:uncharacterized surface protein with fasciclin (FAS1) repeats|nr:fasciclin domain-containing protein [Leptolyngbya sp. Prado105]
MRVLGVCYETAIGEDWIGRLHTSEKIVLCPECCGKNHNGSVILSSGTVKSVAGNPINVQVPQKQIKVNNATVILEDVKVSNGVIHVIDRVLLPPNLK